MAAPPRPPSPDRCSQPAAPRRGEARPVIPTPPAAACLLATSMGDAGGRRCVWLLLSASSVARTSRCAQPHQIANCEGSTKRGGRSIGPASPQKVERAPESRIWVIKRDGGPLHHCSVATGAAAVVCTMTSRGRRFHCRAACSGPRIRPRTCHASSCSSSGLRSQMCSGLYDFKADLLRFQCYARCTRR